MADRSAIEWCDSTFNPWTGCTKISPACDHCYAESLSKRAPKTIAQWGAEQPRRRTSLANWRKPLHWNRWSYLECTSCGWRGSSQPGHAIFLGTTPSTYRCPQCFREPLRPTRRRVFCASLADVFDNEVDPTWRRDLFALIEATPNLDWLLLTKRIGNAFAMLDDARGWAGWTPCPGTPWREPLPNVWLGATICNQAEADRDIPKLLATPARVRFLSIEPMLGPIEINGFGDGVSWCPICSAVVFDGIGKPHELMHDIPVSAEFDPAAHCASVYDMLHWVIAGGESGPHARPSHPDWFRSLRDQCAAAGVPFLFKQWGEWAPYNRGRHDPASFADPTTGDTPVQRFGKKLAGRLLDGREHSEFPA